MSSTGMRADARSVDETAWQPPTSADHETDAARLATTDGAGFPRRPGADVVVPSRSMESGQAVDGPGERIEAETKGQEQWQSEVV